MSGSQRRKGRIGENELVSILRESGWNARRISEPGLPGPDVEWMERHVEVKRRGKDHYKTIYELLDDAQLFAIRADRRPWIAGGYLDTILDLLEEEYDRGYREGRRRANP